MKKKEEISSIFEDSDIEKIRDFLLEQKQTIAVAESVTAGFLQAALASAKDASLFFQGGITPYNLGQKSRHLAIEPIHALSCNCVSEKVAVEMALSVCKLFGSDWGIGITGYAAPVPESGNKIFAHYALTKQNKVIMAEKITAEKKAPVAVQISYVNYLLKRFNDYLKKQKLKRVS